MDKTYFRNKSTRIITIFRKIYRTIEITYKTKQQNEYYNLKPNIIF